MPKTTNEVALTAKRVDASRGGKLLNALEHPLAVRPVRPCLSCRRQSNSHHNRDPQHHVPTPARCASYVGLWKAAMRRTVRRKRPAYAWIGTGSTRGHARRVPCLTIARRGVANGQNSRVIPGWAYSGACEASQHQREFGEPHRLRCVVYDVGSGGGTRTPDTRIMIPLL